MRATRCAHAAVLSLALLLGAPAAASAQKAAFVDAFVAFHSALFGTYGDEGPDVTAALERMSASLGPWESREADARTAATAALEAAMARDQSDPIAAYLRGLQLSEAAHRDATDPHDALQPLIDTLMRALDGPGLTTKQPVPVFALVDDLSAKTRVFAPAAYERGFALALAGRFREAVESFRATAARDPLVIDPAGRSAHFRQGLTALRQRRGRAAADAIEAVVRDFPSSAEAHRVLGIVYRAAARLPESITQFQEAVRLAPRDERSRVLLGSTLIEAGRLNEAERTLRDAIAQLPASGEAKWALADVYERLERGADAIAVLEESTSLIVVAGKVHLYWRIAQLAHLLHRDHRRVIDVLTRRMRLVPNEPHAHKDLALAYSRAGRDDEALLELLMTRLLGHEDAETLTAIGQIHLNRNEPDRAETALRRAVSLDAKHAEARYAFGRALQRLGRQAEATEQLAAFDRLRAAALEEQRLKYEREAGAARR